MNKPTILMATMSLDLGGAETHIVELCRGLNQRGYQIIVVSNGGSYVEELEKEGIIHMTAPLHTRNILALGRSFQIIKKTIQTYQVKIVHAHARIPAFICGVVKKFVPFHFFTTAHGAHSTAFPLVLLSDWGEKTFVVSADLQDYLLDHYKISKRDILMTVNGINTENIHKDVDGTSLFKEFPLQPTNKRIVSISRLDKDMSATPHALIELAPELDKLYGNIEIIIIGHGDDYASILEKATSMNQQLQKEMIFVTSARYDIPKWLSITDLFVNVSRSALEAMAAECPVILSGNQGYLGLFTKDKVELAKASNFTGRNAPKLTKEGLLKDIQTALNASDQERASWGAYGREMVIQNYSLSTMVDDADNLYTAYQHIPVSRKKRHDLSLSGYYGFHNSGDDTLLHVILDQLYDENPYLKVQVFSRRPKETKKVYGIDAAFMFNPIVLYRQLKRTSLLLMGGGTLIQDFTSTQSLLYYLFVLWVAQKTKADTMLYANGIGPIKKQNEKKVQAILNKMTLITLRDQDSKKLLDRLEINKPPIQVTTDAAFGLENHDPRKGSKKLEALGLSEGKYFCVSVRAWKQTAENFEDIIAATIEYVQNTYDFDVIFIPMQPINDKEISLHIMSKLKRKGYYFGDVFSLDEILYIEEKAAFIMAMRLHTLIYGMIGGTPCLALSYDPKVDGLMSDFNQPYTIGVDEVTTQKLIAYIDEIMEHKDKIRQEIQTQVKKSKDISLQTAKMAINVLEARYAKKD